MTNFISTIQETIVDFTAYIRRIRYAVIGLAAYVFLIHFHMLNSTVPGIDTEHLISDSESLYSSWLGIGRQGLWIVKRLSGNITFNPYFAVILTLLFLVSVCSFHLFSILPQETRRVIAGKPFLPLHLVQSLSVIPS